MEEKINGKVIARDKYTKLEDVFMRFVNLSL